MNYIQGEKFKLLADNNKIFYFHTHEVNNFFKNDCPGHEFILISHNSDGGIFENAIRWYDASFSLAPLNLKKWFGQNVQFKHKKIESLPIGLENSEWFADIKKVEKLKNITTTERKIKNLIYLNVNVETNINERKPVVDILSNKTYVTFVNGKNGYNYDEYLNNLYTHCFVVCPEGNGTDTHRLWETLYAGSIPIHKKTINISYYEDLPICLVDDWSQIEDENFLISEYQKIKSKQWNLEKLNFEYWKAQILQEC
jgi:hypothetical protein